MFFLFFFLSFLELNLSNLRLAAFILLRIRQVWFSCCVASFLLLIWTNHLCMSAPMKMWQSDSWPSLIFALHHSTRTAAVVPFTSRNHGDVRAVPATGFLLLACCSRSSADPVNPSSSLDVEQSPWKVSARMPHLRNYETDPVDHVLECQSFRDYYLTAVGGISTEF